MNQLLEKQKTLQAKDEMVVIQHLNDFYSKKRIERDYNTTVKQLDMIIFIKNAFVICPELNQSTKIQDMIAERIEWYGALK
jgi:hypothetical protein